VLANAKAMAQRLQQRGLRIVSGGTDCHMFLVDLRAKRVTGKDAEEALGRVHITVNKNAIPNDPQKPFVASGIRIGSPAMTTRGFREAEAEVLGGLIADVLDAPQDEKINKRVTAVVAELCRAHPVYRAAGSPGTHRLAAH
jgi:glycine hydroxymethyltransferase